MFQLLIAAILVICASGEDPPKPASTTVPLSVTCEGQNEIYLAEGVAPNCDTVCSEIGQPCSRVYVKAPSGCYCLPNHARNASDVCVPISDCRLWCTSWETSSDDGFLSLRVKAGTSGARPLPTLPLPHPRLSTPQSPSLQPSSPSSPSLSSPSLSPLTAWRSHPLLPLPLPHPSSPSPPPPRSLSYSPPLPSVSSISSMSSVSSLSMQSLPPQSRFIQSRLLRPRGVCSYQYFLSSN